MVQEYIRRPMPKRSRLRVEVDRANVIEALTIHSIAVLGHIGLMPQFLRSDGGYRVRGQE